VPFYFPLFEEATISSMEVTDILLTEFNRPNFACSANCFCRNHLAVKSSVPAWGEVTAEVGAEAATEDDEADEELGDVGTEVDTSREEDDESVKDEA